MRAPSRKRALRRTVAVPPADWNLAALAREVRYVGSPEHKSYLSFAGAPKLRADASKCDPRLADADELTSWVRAGIDAGRVGPPWEGRFPRYVWREVEGVVYEARLVNRESGEYKGYPLEDFERPEGL
jgi:hypothetical protein